MSACLLGLSGWNVRGKNTKEPWHSKAEYCGTFFVSLNFIVLSNLNCGGAAAAQPQQAASCIARSKAAQCGGLIVSWATKVVQTFVPNDDGGSSMQPLPPRRAPRREQPAATSSNVGENEIC